MPRRLLSAAAAGALLLGLAACGDETDGPVTTPPPSIDVAGPSDGGGDTEPSDGGGGDETPEPTADAPDIPPPDPADFAGMDEHTPEGAEQAFRYYIAVSVWAHQTGNQDPLPELESGNCEGCAFFNGNILELQEKDLLWSESEISDKEVSVEQTPDNAYEVRYQFTLGPHSRSNNEGTERVKLDSLDFDSAGRMTWNADRWTIDGLSIEWGPDVH